MKPLKLGQRSYSQGMLRNFLSCLKHSAYAVGLLIFSASAFAATSITQLDVEGADDEPGQKDLNSMTTIYDTGDSFDFHVLWQWDETAVSGNNTVDACSLYDTDEDGFANYSLCVTGGGNPIAHQTSTLYSCNNTRVDRCAGPTLINEDPPAPFLNSVCSISQIADPFHAGQNDTQASCQIMLSDLGVANIPILTNVCSYPSKEPNSDPSDCIVGPSDGFLKVTKIAADANGQTFNVSLNPPVPNGYTSLSPLEVDITQMIALPAGTYSLTEAIPNGWQIDDMTCTLGSSTVSSEPNIDMLDGITVGIGRVTTCKVTNSKRAAQLIVKKIVVNNNGGTLDSDDFSISVTGNQADPSSFLGTSSGTTVTLMAGAYTVTEVENTGYQASYSADCSGSIAAGESKVCTITNDDIAPKLTLVKTVKNDNGGTATINDFSPSIDGVTKSWNTPLVVSAGDHTVSETVLDGYKAGAWGGDCSADGKVSLKVGEEKTCTITNDDIAAKLTLLKTVKNDDGGTATINDFTPSVDGTTKSWSTPITLDAGNHSVSESSLSGYEASAWGGACSADGKITLKLGESKTCTITNDDIAPMLKLLKTVINDNGGNAVIADFTPSIDANVISWNTFVSLKAGAHTASETTLVGYQASEWGGDCNANGTITLAVGEKKVCTITNNDIAPKIKLVKTVINDNGGTASANNFTPSIDGIARTWNTVISLSAGPHVVSETTLAGYQAGDWGGGCNADGSITLALGDLKVCTITNNDIAPKLTLQKKIANNIYLGSQGDSADQWTLIAGAVISEKGTLVTSDLARTKTYEVRANTVYALSESGGPAGYTASSWSCTAGGSLTGSQLTLTLGRNVTCTITNTYNRVCETAFSNGTIALKRLVKNARWGWAIELNAPTAGTSYTIFAGQTDSVGSFNIVWNGTQATLTVKLDNDWSAEGFHLYGSDKPPTTAAPGQFNLNGASWQQVAADTYTTTINLTDSADRDGAWLVFHANVCEPKL